MDSNSSYKHIKTDLVDSSKTPFMSNLGNYYDYNIRPFGLNKTYVTYQRLMDTVFSKQIWCYLEV